MALLAHANLFNAAARGDVGALWEAIAGQDEWKKARGADGEAALHVATEEGQVRCVELLLREGADKDARDGKGWTPLHRGAASNRMRCVEALLKAGADKDAKATGGRTPLHFASSLGHRESVELLLSAGADKDAKEEHGCAPLHLAADDGHKACVELLLRAGANKEPRDMHQRTPLHCAARLGSVECAELLLRAGADKDAKREDEVTPLHAAAEGGRVECVELLLRGGADKALRSKDGRTPLHFAAASGRAECVELLLRAGADKEPRSKDGRTPLHFAAASGRAECAERLLRAGADKEVSSEEGRTPLHFAAEGGHKDALELLLRAGADKGARDKGGNTPLHRAVEAKRVESVQLLLNAGADMDAKNDDGRTPLHVATQRGHCECVELLLRARADKEARTKNDWTPLHLAAEGGFSGCLDALLRAGADKNAKGEYGYTPLHEAARNGHEESVRLLLQVGADKDAKENDGWTPLHLAALQGKGAVVELLVSCGADLFAATASDYTDAADRDYPAGSTPASVTRDDALKKRIAELGDAINEIRLREVERGSRNDVLRRLVALRGLRVLDLSGCELKEIPASLSAAAGSLQQLNLSGNEIASVHVLAKLAKLEALDLSLNALAEPPWVLSALPRLRLLSVKGNLRLARDVERLQDAQLLAYLRAGSEDRMRSQTVKFVVLGHELSGKTTLLRALRAHASWYSWRPRVEGIALNDRTREVTLSEEWPAGRTHTDVHFRVLDFPGQPEYFATNRLFLAGLRETVVVICVPLLPIEHVKRVAQGEQLSREALREATDRAIKGDLRVALRLWLTEVNGLLEDEAKEAPEAKKPEILVVHSFGDVASDDLARDWCERGFTTWLKGEKGLQNLVVRGPYLVDSREITGGTSAVRTAIITVGRSIVEFRAQIPRAMYVAQEHVQVLLRPRNVLSLLELRREITALPAIRGSEARVDAALAIMRGQLDVIVSGARAFVNPQWLASFVALFTTPQHLDGLPSAIPAMPFILSKETVRMALQRKLGNEAGDASQVDDLLHVLEELDVLYPLRLRPDHVEYLVPCRFASVDGSYEVNIQYPQAFNATDRLVLCLELEAQNGHSMPLMLLARLLYMFLRLPLFLPRGDGFGAMYRMSRTRLFVKTPLDSQLLLGLVGRSGVELRYVGASRTAFDVQQAELRQLLECVDNALRRTEKWPKVEYSATLRCAGCGGEFNPLNVMCSRQPLHLRLNSTAIDVVCQGIYIDGLRECTKVVRNWNKVARQRSAQPNDAARNDPWPWPRQPQTFTWDRLMQVDRLGEGHFGIVLSARLDGRWPVAVKALRPPKEIADVDKAIREREREAYAYLALSRHRNVVPLVGRVDRVHFGNMVYEGAFVMPLASRGSLEKKLKDYGPLLGREIVDAVAQIAEGLAHLHAHRLLHRDIAPRNLLEFSDGRIALTDFGLSRESQVNEGEELITRVLLEDCFPVRFAAPEVMKTGPNNQYFAASDVWMLALTAWHLITGREPFANIPDSFDAAEAAAEGRVRLEWESLADEVAPRPLRELLAQCCALEREKRPTAAQIAQRARALLDSIGRAPSEVVPPPLDGPLLHGDGEEKLDGGPVPQPPPPPPPPPDQPYPAPPASPAGGAGEAELLARKLDQVLDAVHEIADHRK